MKNSFIRRSNLKKDEIFSKCIYNSFSIQFRIENIESLKHIQ